jgi:hypothetical protein
MISDDTIVPADQDGTRLVTPWTPRAAAKRMVGGSWKRSRGLSVGSLVSANTTSASGEAKQGA